MPFCTNCGSPVGVDNSYCPNCGARQPGAPRPVSARSYPAEPLSEYQRPDRFDPLLYSGFRSHPCHRLLASQRFRYNSRVRFDGFQALYLFVPWLIVSSALPTLLYVGYPPLSTHSEPPEARLFGCWIYLLIKAARTSKCGFRSSEILPRAQRRNSFKLDASAKRTHH